MQIKWKSSYTKTPFVVNSLKGNTSLVTLQTISIYEDLSYFNGPCKGRSVIGPIVGNITATILC